MKIIGLKSNDGFYFRLDSYGDTDMTRFTFDGEVPTSTFKEGWYKTKKCFSKVEELKWQPPINQRYELKDKDKFKNLKHTYNKEDVSYKDSDGNNLFTDEFKDIVSLYKFKEDSQPKKTVEVDFDLNIVGEVDNITTPPDFNYNVNRTKYYSDGVMKINSNDIKNSLIDEINTPDILLHEKPCSISSRTFYKIIRTHIKENINSKYAEITSDYDFCFTVKKRIEKAEPEQYTIDVNNSLFSRRNRKPKYKTRYRKERLVDFFEMTNDEDKYKGYTVIKGIIAVNKKELCKKIDEYLEKLMKKMNEPLKDCPNCKGMGVIVED